MSNDAIEIAELRKAFEELVAGRKMYYSLYRNPPGHPFEGQYTASGENMALEMEWQAALWAHQRATQWRSMETLSKDEPVIAVSRTWMADTKRIIVCSSGWLPLPEAKP